MIIRRVIFISIRFLTVYFIILIMPGCKSTTVIDEYREEDVIYECIVKVQYRTENLNK